MTLCCSNQQDPDFNIYMSALIKIFMVDMKSKLTLFISLTDVAGFFSLSE